MGIKDAIFYLVFEPATKEDRKIDKYMTGQIRESQKQAHEFSMMHLQTELDHVAFNKYVQNRLGPKGGKKNRKDTSARKHILYWFYYGDLLDTVLKIIREFSDEEYPLPPQLLLMMVCIPA